MLRIVLPYTGRAQRLTSDEDVVSMAVHCS